MANQTIGAVDIELVANLVKFKLGMQDASDTASRSSKKIKESFQKDTEQARESIDLLSESAGVRLPRALKSIISAIPGVNSALASIANVAAFVAVIGVVGEVVSKVLEYRDAVQKADETWKSFLTSNLADQNKQRDALAQSIIKVEASRDAVAALRLQYQELKRDISGLSPEIDKFKAELDQALAPRTGLDTWLGTLQNAFSALGLDKSAAQVDHLRDHTAGLTIEIDNFHKSLSEIANTQGTTAALKELDRELTSVYQRLHTSPNDEGLKKFKDDLEALQRSFSTEATKKFYDGLDLAKQGADTLSDGVKNLKDKLSALLADNDPIGNIRESFRKTEEELQKSAAENPEIFKKAFPNDNINDVIRTLEKLKASLIDGELAKGAADAEKALKSIKIDPNAIKFPTPQLPTLAPNASVPTSLQKELDNLSSKEPALAQAAIANEAQKVVDTIETENQKYEEQVALVDKLQSLGVITAAQAKAYKNAIDPAAQAWRSFGEDVGNTAKEAALFGRSWGDALKSLVLDLLQVIAKMTILKDLQATAAGGGVGGFFANILGGLFGGGHAEGGAVNPGTTYLVGEKGPELFMSKSAGAIVPNHALGGGSQRPVIQYTIDARGAAPGTEDRIRQAIAQSENRAVVRSVHAVNDLQRRR